MSVLVDTNVLLRRAQPNHEAHSASVMSLANLVARGEPVYYAPQNIVEFWNVATRPADKNGLGFTAAATAAEIGRIEAFLDMLPDSREIFPAWRLLVLKYGIAGVKVHDARLAAVALVYGVSHLLTFNVGDFKRFDHIALIHPNDVGSV